MLLSLAAMISSRTTLAASMRACKSSRLEAAKALDVSKKQRQIEVIVFFIFVFRSFPLRSPRGRGLLSPEEKNGALPAAHPDPANDRGWKSACGALHVLDQPTVFQPGGASAAA